MKTLVPFENRAKTNTRERSSYNDLLAHYCIFRHQNLPIEQFDYLAIP
jgi:hypothetical protein